MTKQNLLKELQLIVGKENVLSSPEDLVCYSYDAAALRAGNLPDAAVLPGSTEEIVNLLHLATARGIKIVPRGAGTGLTGGTIPIEGGIIIQFTRMNRILEIDSHNLTATVEPGVITSALHSAVEQVGLFYPPDPASANVSTIGGNVAESAGGLRGLKYGTTKDYVLGLETVLASGEVLVTGGKTVKNVAGYDLTKLLVGSEGTLCIFTKIILRLIPLPETKRTLLAIYPNFQDAASSVSDIIANRILPCTLEFLDKVTVNCVESYIHIGIPQNAEAILLIEVDGSKGNVEWEAEKIMEICYRHQPLEVKLALNPAEALSLTLARRSAFPSLARLRPTTLLEDIAIPPSRLVEMVSEINRIVKKYNIQVGTFGHAGDGNLHLVCVADERDEEEMKRVEAAMDEVLEVTLKLEGTIAGEHGIGLTKMRFLPWQIKPSGLKVMKMIKEGFDPQNILNPGKIFTKDSPETLSQSH